MNDKEIKIYGTLVNHTTDNTVAYARQVMDESFNTGEFQNEINMRIKNIRNENGKTYVDSELAAPTITADNIIKGDSPVMTAADVQATLSEYYDKTSVNSLLLYIRQSIPSLDGYYTKDLVDGIASSIRQSIPNMDNYYTKSDITSLLEGLSPQQGNITRLNIYDEQDSSKYSYIKCELDRYEEPRIFIPNLYVDDTVEADSINIINTGTVGTLQIMNLDRFSENEPNISVSANLIPANGRETIGNEDHPWNAVYTSDLAVTGDAYFTGAFAVNAIESYTDNRPLRLSGDVQVSGDVLPNTEISNTLGSEDYRWNGWFEVLNVGDLYVNGEELPFNNYYTKSEVDGLIAGINPGGTTGIYDDAVFNGTVEYNGDLILGKSESEIIEYVGREEVHTGRYNTSYIKIHSNGSELLVDPIYLSPDYQNNQPVSKIDDAYGIAVRLPRATYIGDTPVYDVLWECFNNISPIKDSASLVNMLNSSNIHTVSILADTNSDPLDVRCNKFVNNGDNLTVSVYNNAGELYGYYDVSIYTPSGHDITDSFTITDNSGTFIINNVNRDILIKVVMQSAPIPPLNPDLEEPDLGD